MHIFHPVFFAPKMDLLASPRTEEFPFASLSPDLQSLVLRSLKETKPSSRSLTSAIRKATKIALLDDECNLPISPKEVEKYVADYEPILQAEFFFNDGKRNLWWCYIAKITITNGRNSDVKYIVENHPTEEYSGRFDLGNIKQTDAEQFLAYMKEDRQVEPEENTISPEQQYREYDLMTMYYCYRNRETCLEIDPCYAEKKTLEHFEESMCALSYETMLVFLRANAQVMGIQTDYRSYKKSYHDDNYNCLKPYDPRIKRECKMLEKQIRKRLLALQPDEEDSSTDTEEFI